MTIHHHRSVEAAGRIPKEFTLDTRIRKRRTSLGCAPVGWRMTEEAVGGSGWFGVPPSGGRHDGPPEGGTPNRDDPSPTASEIVSMNSRAQSRLDWRIAKIAFIALILLWCVASVHAAGPLQLRPDRILRLARPTDPRSLDPVLADASQDILLQPLLYQPLLDLTNGTVVVNNLTRNWEISAPPNEP